MSIEDLCVCCGEYVPEGRQVCPACEKKYLNEGGSRDEGNGSSYMDGSLS